MPSPKPCFPDRNTLNQAIADGTSNGFANSEEEPSLTWGAIKDWCFEPTLEDFSSLFNSKTGFNEDIRQWDVSSVTNMEVSLKNNWSFV